MPAWGKPLKNRPRRKSHRTRNTALAGSAIALIAAIAIAVALAATGGETASSSGGGKHAVIVDQLSLTQPNPDFEQQATSLLKAAGYQVDYYPGDQIDLDFYHALPKLNTDLLIMRVHAGEVADADYVGLFTSERWEDSRHVQSPRRLGKGRYFEDSTPLVVIGPNYVTSGMTGRFNGTQIVLMGCDGMKFDTMAKAFLARGASAVAGWSDKVSAAHTDAATLDLLARMLSDSQSLQEAVPLTAAKLGPDPAYNSELKAYP